MAALTTVTGAALLRPEDVQALVITPLLESAVATRISTVVQTGSTSTRFPIVITDPTTAWVSEGSEITPSDQAVDEIDVIPKKLAGLTIITNELANDSDPAALQVVGAGLVRDLQTRLDAAYFGSSVANGPSGLLSLTGVQHVASGAIDDLDAFAEAISKAETVGVQLTSFVAHPTTVLAIQQLKAGSALNSPLLSSDPSSPTKRSVFGVPLYTSPAIATGIVWGIPSVRAFVVIRSDATLAVDPSAYFSSDRTGVRCTLRVGFGFPHQAGIVKVSNSGS